jgi:hypothetical protein
MSTTSQLPDAEVVNILANLSKMITIKVYTKEDLISAEKNLHDSTALYNISKNKLIQVLKKHGINSNEYQDSLNTLLSFSNKVDAADYKYNEIKKSLNFI